MDAIPKGERYVYFSQNYTTPFAKRLNFREYGTRVDYKAHKKCHAPWIEAGANLDEVPRAVSKSL